MTRQAFEHIAHELRPRLKDIGRRFFGDEDRAEDENHGDGSPDSRKQ